MKLIRGIYRCCREKKLVPFLNILSPYKKFPIYICSICGTRYNSITSVMIMWRLSTYDTDINANNYERMAHIALKEE